jgi:hypothetical protein
VGAKGEAHATTVAAVADVNSTAAEGGKLMKQSSGKAWPRQPKDRSTANRLWPLPFHLSHRSLCTLLEPQLSQVGCVFTCRCVP